ncbi:MAG TPA: hypothetical protein VFQ39_12125 [Longimicrobium sp.]|nr:hypothetical protein [Longimicrobium sp.]
MPRRNRVTPRGEVVATPARGTWIGNRGCIHDAEGRIVRPFRVRRWIVCALEFKGRRREIMRPGRWTELFFLDEATALAAGHRPCAECRRPAFDAYVAAWKAGNPALVPPGRLTVAVIDDALHRKRASPPEKAPLDGLPDGVFIALPGDPRPLLLHGGALLAWSDAGYTERIAKPLSATVEVLTPRSTVNAIRAGYRPHVHFSAFEPSSICG